MSKPDASHPSSVIAKEQRPIHPTLGLHNHSEPQAHITANALQQADGETEWRIKALPVYSDEQRQARARVGSHAWLKLITSSNYEQAQLSYQPEYTDLIEQQADFSQLIGLAEHLIKDQHYKEAVALIETILASNRFNEKAKQDLLALLIFITDTITGAKHTSTRLLSIEELWTTAQKNSTVLDKLLTDCICIKAAKEMASGRRKSAKKLLCDFKNVLRKHGNTCNPRVKSLLEFAGYGRSDRLQGKLRKQLEKSKHVKYYKNYACAVDAVRVCDGGRLIVVCGWYIGTQSASLNIGIAKYPHVFASEGNLMQRFHRPDLVEIEKRYGLGPETLSSFTCTLLLNRDADNKVDWGDGELVEVIISTDSTLTSLFCETSHQELRLGDARQIVNQVMGNDMTLKNYAAAKAIKSIWKQRIESLSSQEVSHHIFGEQEQQPDISILIPLYGRLDFMEFQLHWFFCSQTRRKKNEYRYQLIYCLDDPGQKGSLLRLAQKCSMLYKIPFEIVVNPANLGFAGANNMAARYAKSETLLLLNSDILPRDDHAIDTLIKCYQAMPDNKGVLGAKLLYPSKDIQHVGMTFFMDSTLPGILASSWLNEHPHKYIKHTSNPKLQSGIIETEAATAACLMISKDLFNQLGGFRLDFISGDFEDSDLCLRVRGSGRSVMVCLDAIFYHLERQSMVLQTTHDQEALKMVAFNAFTHHEFHALTIRHLKSMLINSDAAQNNPSLVQS